MKELLNILKHPFDDLKNIKNLAQCCMLVALSTITSFVTTVYPSAFLKISFTFIFLAIIGAKFGPVICGVCAAMADVLLCIIRPVGPYQPLLTLSAFAAGVLYGLFLYKNKCTLPRVIAVCATVGIVINQFVNTLFISMLYGKVFSAYFMVRLPKNLIMLPIEIILIYVTLNAINRITKKS